MHVATKRKPAAIAADLLAIPEDARSHEIIDGEIVRKAIPSAPRFPGQRERLSCATRARRLHDVGDPGSAPKRAGSCAPRWAGKRGEPH